MPMRGHSGLDLHIDWRTARAGAPRTRAARRGADRAAYARCMLLPPSRALAPRPRDRPQHRGRRLRPARRRRMADRPPGVWDPGRGPGRKGSTRALVPSAVGGALRYDLRAGYPDCRRFPRTAWLAAARRLSTRHPAEASATVTPRTSGTPRAARRLPRARPRRSGHVRAARGVLRVYPGPRLLGGCPRRGATTVGVESHGHRHHRDRSPRSALARPACRLTARR